MAGRTNQESEKIKPVCFEREKDLLFPNNVRTIMERVEEFNSPEPNQNRERNYGIIGNPGRFMDFVGHYPRTAKIIGHCAMCKSPLTKDFPEDFPNDWKFCCICKAIAEEISKGIPSSDFWHMETANKIHRKITLVGK